jgi:hypothetical protein
MKDLKSAADAGDVRSLCVVGYLYELGLGVKKDKEAASDYYKNAKGAGWTCDVKSGKKELRALIQQSTGSPAAATGDAAHQISRGKEGAKEVTATAVRTSHADETLEANNKIIARLHESASLISQIMSSEEPIPADVIAKAECIVTIPDVEGRSGFISCRGPKGLGWSAPAGVILTSGTLTSALVAVIMNGAALYQISGGLALDRSDVWTAEFFQGHVVQHDASWDLLAPDNNTNAILYHLGDLQQITTTMKPPPGTREMLAVLSKWFA